MDITVALGLVVFAYNSYVSHNYAHQPHFAPSHGPHIAPSKSPASVTAAQFPQHVKLKRPRLANHKVNFVPVCLFPAAK